MQVLSLLRALRACSVETTKIRAEGVSEMSGKGGNFDNVCLGIDNCNSFVSSHCYLT